MSASGTARTYCLGAALARLEARVVLTALFDRATDIRPIAGRAWAPRPGLNVHRPQRLPVRYTVR